MDKPRAIDLFCGDGGATKGLQRAGFHVTGVDIAPHPKYCGNEFIQADALSVDLSPYDFAWASPPCQAFSSLRHLHKKERPNLIPETRRKLVRAQVVYCIENVPGAPLGDPGFLIMLCGTMFGLQTRDGRGELRRHRLFETSFSIPLRPECQHGTASPLSVCGKGGHFSARTITVAGMSFGESCERESKRRKVLTVCGHTPVDNTARRTMGVVGHSPVAGARINGVREVFTVAQAREAMGIDWMTMKGLSQAIPPVYSEFIGKRALEHMAWAQAKEISA